jgi:glycosyltransferase involved in cell wall biosynthesis
LLLKAFAAVRREAGRERTSLQLVFVGPDESGMKAKLDHLTKQLDLAEQVHFCGPLGGEAKWSAYQDADIFVLPSQNENFGNTAAEAAAAGTPVVVTEECGIAPLLKDAAGLVVRHEEGEMARALSLLLKDEELYGKLKAGCAGVAAKLGWEEPVQEMEVLYSGLAGRPRS